MRFAILIIVISFLTGCTDTTASRADIKVTKVECAIGKPGYIATADVKKTYEGHLDKSIEIYFEPSLHKLSFLEGDEAKVKLHKENDQWIVRSPEHKEVTILSSAVLPTCK